MAQNTNRPANKQKAPKPQAPIVFKDVPGQPAVEFIWPDGKRGGFGFNKKGEMKLVILEGKKKIIDVTYLVY